MNTSDKEKLKPKVLITHEAKLKQNRLIANCPVEVSWFGFVDTIEIGNTSYLRVYDIAVPDQEVTGGSVDIEGTFNDFMEREAERVHEMNFFAHSHHTMSAYHSPTDVEQILDWAEKLGIPWFLSHVQNKKGEYSTRYDQFKPFKMHVEEINMVETVPAEIETWAKEQLKKYVTVKSNTHYSSHTHSSHKQGPKLATKYEQAEWGGKTSNDFKIKYSDSDTMYADADEIWIRHIREIRERIVDGYIRERENTITGEYWVFREPSEEELEEHATRQLLANGEDDLKSRSIARSMEKRVEGKAVALLERATGRTEQDEHHPIQTANDPKRKNNDGSSVKLAAQQNGKPNNEVIPSEVEHEDDYVGSIETDPYNLEGEDEAWMMGWSGHVGSWIRG